MPYVLDGAITHRLPTYGLDRHRHGDREDCCRTYKSDAARNTRTSGSSHRSTPAPRPPIRLLEQEKIGDVRDLPWTKRSSMEEVACHREIAAYIREHVLKLEAIARRDYYGDDPEKSPYSVAPG